MSALSEESEISPHLRRDYWCFISYRHADNKEPGRQWATWLHQAIETYEVPADLAGTRNERGDLIPDRIFPVFRDEEELPADAELSKPIEAALTRSRFLVVLCSPLSVQSRWVADEILRFKQLGKENRILAAIIEGSPNASHDPSKPGANTECFPEPLRFEINESGELTQKRTEPVAADFRLPDGTQSWTSQAAYREWMKARKIPDKQISANIAAFARQQNLMLLKIIAGILGVPLGVLTRRDKAYQLEKQRQRAQALRRWLVALSVLVIAALASGAMAITKQREAEAQTREADKQRRQVEQERNKQDELLLTASRGDHEAAMRSLAAGRSHEAFTYLARALQLSPENDEARSASIAATVGPAATGWPIHGAAICKEPIKGLRFSPDGNTFAATLLDDTLQVFETAGGKLLGDIEGGNLYSLAHATDGRWLLAKGEGKAIRITDIRSGEVLRSIESAEAVQALEFSPDGSRLALATIKLQVRIMETATGAELRKLEVLAPVGSFVFAPDNAHLAIACYQDHSVMVETATGKIVWKLPVEEGVVPAQSVQSFYGSLPPEFSFSPDSTLFVVEDNELVVFETSTGTEVSRSDIRSLVDTAFTADSRRIVLTDGDGALRVINAADGATIQTLVSEGVSATASSPDGRWLASADAEGGILIHDIDGASPVGGIHPGVKVDVISFSPDGRWLALAGRDHVIRIVKAASSPFAEPLELDAPARALSFRPDKEEVAVGTDSGAVFVLDSSSGSILRRIALKSSATPIAASAVAFSPDGKSLASGFADNTIVITTTADGTEVRTFELGNPLFSEGIRSMHYSNDGRWLCAGSEDRSAWVIETATGTQRDIQLTEAVTAVAFSPQGLLAIGGKDAVVKILEPASMTVIRAIDLPAMVNALVYSPDGSRLFAAASDHTVRIIDPNSDNISGTIDAGGWINSIAVHPGGKLLGIGVEGNRVRLVSVASGKEIATIPLPQDGVTGILQAIAFHPGGRSLAAAGNAFHYLDLLAFIRRAEPFSESWGKFLQLRAGHRFEPGGKLRPLAAEEWIDCWNAGNHPAADLNPDERSFLEWSSAAPERSTVSSEVPLPVWRETGKRLIKATPNDILTINTTANAAPWHPLAPVSLARIPPADRDVERQRFLARLTLRRLGEADPEQYSGATLADYAVEAAVWIETMGFFNEALDASKIALAARPDDDRALRANAYGLVNLERYAESVEVFRKLIARPEPTTADLADAALFAAKAGQADFSSKVIVRAYERFPDHPRLARTEGWIHFFANDPAAAMEAFNRSRGWLKENEKPDGDLLVGLTVSHWLAGARDPQEKQRALALCHELLVGFPEFGDPRNLEGSDPISVPLKEAVTATFNAYPDLRAKEE